MNVRVNRGSVDVPDLTTVEGLREIIGLPQKGIAIAVNGRIVLSGDRAATLLRENDDVVIIGAAYGG